MRLVHVKHYKRGAYWPDGSPRMCTRCGIEIKLGDRSRRNQATTTATILDGKYRVPVGYCPTHEDEAVS